MEIDTLAVDLEKLCQQIFFDVVTKRTILQTLASVYDPLGMLSPFVIKMKFIFQEAWKQSLAWDEILPASMLHEWKKSVSEIHLLRALTISRYVFDSPHQVEKQLHIFADASPKAYGSVAYIRSRNLDENIRISFLYAKSRLAPIRDKRITLPKMELCADLEAARMRCYLVEKLRVKFDSIYLWTDSKITLYWIRSIEFQKDVFVYNRVQEIQQLTANDNWNHCPGSINPADLLTRGVSAQTLLSCETWLNGPSWLYNDISEWPISDQDFETPMTAVDFCLLTIPQSTTQSDCAVPDNPIQIERFSQYRRLLRVTAYVLRYVDLLRKRVGFKEYLNADELRRAELFWIKRVQFEVFKEEINALSNRQLVPKCSKILSLNPFVDNDGILRVGSSLGESELEFDEMYLVILSKSSHLTSLIIIEAHEKTFHRRTNFTLVYLRKRF
ncbi:unnamed protein product [Hermetia illucens]|uniref:Uncharacterized protein n=1 Tax=Hermetia illucens TaxID=343691 RepID=A0A7R8Z0E2_HERIL|nr:unnamed protein product [Hermetia illucens]